MENLSLYSSEKIYYNYDLGGLGSRFIGMLLDTLIIFASYLVIGIFSITVVKNIDDQLGLEETTKYIIIAVVLVILFLINFGYFIFFETVWNGQTPGKRGAGLRVVRKNGEAITFGNVLARNLMRIIDSLPSGYAVGILMILFNKNHQRLGDMVADTVVVREKKNLSPALFGDNDINPALAAKIRPNIYRIEEKDMSLITEFFKRRQSMDSQKAQPLAQNIAHGLAVKIGLAEGEQYEPESLMRTIGALFREK